MRSTTGWQLAAVGSLLLAWPQAAGAQAAAPSAPLATRPTPELIRQIESLLAEKQRRSPAERKVSSQLLYAGRARQGLAPAPGVADLHVELGWDPEGRVLVDVRGDVTPRLQDRVAELGGTVLAAFPERRTLRAALPLEAVVSLAELPELVQVRPAGLAVTRAVSEGDVAHRADVARSTFGVDGTGVKIGVLSDGVDSLASRQAAGELPTIVTVLSGQAGSGDEGTAMLEIVYDLAPGADLLFATAFISQASFASNILALRTAGADIIVDDVGYFAESVFQDDDVAAAVDTVVADGALYFSSAGNSGNLNDGTSGVWQGDYVYSGGPFNGADAHEFSPGVIDNEVTEDAPFVVTLHWSDPKGASGNDYDLFLANKPLSVLFGSSTDVQDGNDDPYEAIGASVVGTRGKRLIVVRQSGSTRMLHLSTNRGELAIATDGQTSGHATANGAYALAAVDARIPGGAGGVFDGSESVQTYSSDGPRRVHLRADGSEITPGDLTETGGELRAKPDFTAADCVTTTTAGFTTFCGTSASAPHAAAIAALLLEAATGSGLGAPEVRLALQNGALDIEAAGSDRDSGVGIADALDWLQAAADACDDGQDNDGDGQIDLADPGCDDNTDFSERSELLVCDNGFDDDGDGFTDYDADAGEGDPGCGSSEWLQEDPQCQDGLDNDGDGFTDFDAGASVLVTPDPDGADPECVLASTNKEASSPPTGGSCGLGGEILVLLLPLLWGKRRRANA